MSSGSRFEFEVRVLLCEACGAPVDATRAGGSTTCRYCKVVLQIAARDALPELAPVPVTALAEPERLARLAAQESSLGREAPVHPGLATVLERDAVPAWRTQEAFVVWQSLRKRAPSEPVAADELSYLTGKLCAGLDGEPERQRALLESTLEALTLPRHRQLELGALVDGAVRAGDLQAAERWLTRCDASLDDLAADSAYRIARALVATAHRSWADVLAVLGAGNEGVPLRPECRTLAALMRGNAHRGLGDPKSARSVLAGTYPRELEAKAARFPQLFDASLLDLGSAASRSQDLRRLGWAVLVTAIGGGLIAIGEVLSGGRKSALEVVFILPGSILLTLGGLAVLLFMLPILFSSRRTKGA
jgi:hypothetical protein